MLSQTRHLRTILTEGMRAALWDRLCDTVLAEATKLVGEAIARHDILSDQPTPNRPDVVRLIKRNLRAGRLHPTAERGRRNDRSAPESDLRGRRLASPRIVAAAGLLQSASS